VNGKPNQSLHRARSSPGSARVRRLEQFAPVARGERRNRSGELNRWTTLKAVALFVAASFTACSAIADPNVAGLWSANERTKGGLASQWLFTRDGRVTASFGAVVDFAYRIEGNKLITTFSQPGEAQEETAEEFILSGDVLTVNPNDAQAKQVMKRVGRPVSGATPIVGTWTYQHYTGKQATNRYSSKGVMLLSVPFQNAEGTYKFVDGRLVINLEGQPPSEVVVEVMGATMAMTDGGTKRVFTRFDF
jgi:hypothetical protein